MYKLLAISLLVLCAEIHSLDIQNDQQKPIQTDKVIKEQKVEVKDTIVPNEKVPINPNQQSSIQTDKETKEQKVKVSDTVLPNEKASINSNPGSQPTEGIKKLTPKISNEQIQSLADQVLAIHGVKEGEDDPENIQRAARLTKVVENVVKNLETKLKEKKEGENLSGSEQVAAKNENLATGSLDEKKAGIPEENVSITKDAGEKQKLETNAKVGSENPESNVKATENIKSEENVQKNEKTIEKQNGKGQKAENVDEILKKAQKEQILQENINEEINKPEGIKIDIIDIATETKQGNVETIKIEIKPETAQEDSVQATKVEQVIVKEIEGQEEVKRNEFADADVEEQLEELEDAIEEDNAKRGASEAAEPTNQENEDTENSEEEVKYTEDYGYFTIIVDFIYDKFLSN